MTGSKSGRCIGVSNLRWASSQPRWQFEPAIWPALQPMAKSLGTSDGWQLLAFLESPATALDGQTPRDTTRAHLDAAFFYTGVRW